MILGTIGAACVACQRYFICMCHFASISGPGFSSKDGEERWRGGGLSDLKQDLKTWMRISIHIHPPGETYPHEGLWICGAGRAASNYGPIGRNLTKVSLFLRNP